MRLDNYLVEVNIFDSRTKAKQAIKRGEIFVENKMIDKPSYQIEMGANVNYIYSEKFVSLGGYKLNKALKDFGFKVEGFTCADIGASTGGFTDCLLKNNAKLVYSVDLNDQLLHCSLKENDNVVSIIKNAKLLLRDDFCNDLDLIVADLSFISATMVLDVFSKLVDNEKFLILLIKPQFEVGNKVKFKNGIIKDKKIQEDACRKVIDCAKTNNFNLLKITTAPITEGKNLEYLALFQKSS